MKKIIIQIIVMVSLFIGAILSICLKAAATDLPQVNNFYPVNEEIINTWGF